MQEVFGNYLLVRQIAQSSIAEVSVARSTDAAIGICAIKRFLPAVYRQPGFRERFESEAQLLVRMIHGNVVQVHEVGEVNDQPFIAMELLTGVDLGQLVAQSASNPLPAAVIAYIALELCDACGYIQQRRKELSSQIIPADHAWPLELIVTTHGLVKLIDLGSAGTLRLGAQKTKDLYEAPGFTSPEIIRKASLDARSDVFAIGVVLWELLHGRRLVAEDPVPYIHSILDQDWQAPPVRRDDVPRALRLLVDEMLEREPDGRPQSTEEVRNRLADILRQKAPDFNREELALFMKRNLSATIGPDPALIEEILDEADTERIEHTRQRTLSFSLASEAQRTVRDPIPFQVGDRLPGTRYRIVRKLGEGASAEVYAAQHIDLDRRVALKVLAPSLASNARGIELFRLEARTCSRLGHPNIVEVTDFGELDDGRFYFTMELLDGRSLADLLAIEQRLEPIRALKIFQQIGQAAQAAHEAGIIHRDLKPENVMLVNRPQEDDFVKVLDFGVMAFDQQENYERVGTPGYMAPEQGDRQAPAPAMDIYALGASLYEALCGELPYSFNTTAEYVSLTLEQPPTPLEQQPGTEQLPVALVQLVHRALSRDPRSRPPSMADFVEQLRAIEESLIGEAATDPKQTIQPIADVDTEPLPAPAKQPTRDKAKRPGRRRQLVGISLLLATAALALFLKHKSTTGDPPIADLSSLTNTNDQSRAADMRSGAAGKESERLSSKLTPQKKAAKQASPQAKTEPNAQLASGEAVATEQGATTADERAAARFSGQDARRKTLKALLRAGRTLLRDGQPEAAQRKFNEALRIDRRNYNALLGMAEAAFDKSQYLNAIDFAQRATRVSRRPLQAQLLLGDAYYKLLRYKRALKAWQEVTRFAPGHSGARDRIEQVREMIQGNESRAWSISKKAIAASP